MSSFGDKSIGDKSVGSSGVYSDRSSLRKSEDNIQNVTEEVRGQILVLHDNDESLIIDKYFYESFSTPQTFKERTLNSLDTLSDVRIKAFTLLF